MGNGGPGMNSSSTDGTPPEATEPATESMAPPYWDEACRHLMRKDRILRRIIPEHPGLFLQSRGDAFGTLARSIVGQQISTSAAQTVWKRFIALPGNASPSPASIQELPADAMRAAGLSGRKVEYLQSLCTHFEDGSLHVQEWAAWPDEAIIKELIAVRGIGRWTAEMFLMFHLLRPNVLPLDDAGLIQGISRNYFSGEPVSRIDAREVAHAWKPWRSVATWYIWRSLLPQPQNY